MRRPTLLQHSRGRSDAYAAANRSARPNVSLWLAVGLLVPALYGLALAIAAVVDAWHGGA